MLVTNLTSNVYDLPGLRLHALEAAAIVDDVRYFADERFRLELNTLFGNGKISVTGAPDGFPVATAEEIEIANGEVPGAAGNGGFSPPAAWTVDDATGRFVLTYVTPGFANTVPALEITQTGVPLDYTPMFWVGGDDPTLAGTQVFSIDSSGDADWEFRDSAVSLIFHRMHDGDDSALVKIGESAFWVSNTTHHTSMLEADYDSDYLQVGASTSTLAFFATGGATKQTGVAVTADGIHAALVAYGLIAA